MDDLKTKKDIIEKIKSSSNILITVSNNPSVDALSAALGLTLALNKIDKYATAIYSGATPPAISFLEPEKTFEENTDSLRDFIIALNKEKADHLRFKPEGDYVRIYITPYRSVITPEDLEFSQGDFNVELVIAIGVESKETLDDALDNHGQILHDATVVSITSSDTPSSLGSVNWNNNNVSSLSEAVAGLVESLKDDKKNPIIDGPIATALLTGIVAETERFSNSHTTSHVMTVAANLMSAGADQQLIASELEQSQEVPVIPEVEPAAETVEAEATTVEEPVEPVETEESVYTLNIERNEPTAAYSLPKPDEPVVAPVEEPQTTPEPEVAETTEAETVSEPVVVEPVAEAPVEEPAQVASEEPAPAAIPVIKQPSSVFLSEKPEPDNPDEPKREEPGQSINSEGYISNSEPKVIEPISSDLTAQSGPVDLSTQLQAELQPQFQPQPAPGPVDLGLPLPPPLPDFSNSQAQGAYAQPEILGDILAPEQPTIGVPNTLEVPPVAQATPDANSAYAFTPEPVLASEFGVNPAPAPNQTLDPAQYQIPAQP